MERNASTLNSVFQSDELAFGVASGQCFLGGLAVQSFGNLIDGFSVSFGAGDPLGTHRQSVHRINVFVGGCWHSVDCKERACVAKRLRLCTFNGQQSNAAAT